MKNPENCKGFLRIVLGLDVDHVEVSREKSIVYHPEYKGVRLDVYAKDEKNTRYNVEMQISRKPALGRRGRYYQRQVDMEMLLAGSSYDLLPDSYVVFICDFDPFGEKRYRYTFENCCKETDKAELKDGRSIILLSTRGENDSGVPEELVNFLKFVKADLKESRRDFQDAYVRQLQEFITQIKSRYFDRDFGNAGNCSGGTSGKKFFRGKCGDFDFLDKTCSTVCLCRRVSGKGRNLILTS